MLGLTFFSKLGCGSYIVSIAKTASKKAGALILCMKFLSPELALYLYKPAIRPCMECCCHVWAGASRCYLELINKLRKRICRTVDPSLAASLEHLGLNLITYTLKYAPQEPLWLYLIRRDFSECLRGLKTYSR